MEKNIVKMGKNCFANIPHASLDFCPNDENGAGVSTRVHYIPLEFLEKMDLPKLATKTGGYAESITIPKGNLVIKKDKGWKGIDVLVDENELKNSLVGSKGNTKQKSELECFIPSITDKVVGFIKVYKNVPMIFAVRDTNGVIWMLGTKTNPAFVESAEGTTGKKFEDNAGVTVKISANTSLYKYDGPIAEA